MNLRKGLLTCLVGFVLCSFPAWSQQEPPTADSAPSSSRGGLGALLKGVVDSVNEAAAKLRSQPRPTPASTASRSSSPAPQALADSAPRGTPLSATPLSGLFAKHPYDGTAKSHFPRVAVTVRDWKSSSCWLFDARIWWSASRSEKLNGVSVCWRDSLSRAADNAVNYQLFMRQLSAEHSGNVRTEGPKPPMMAYATDPFGVAQYEKGQQAISFIQQLLIEIGWQPGAPTNLWVVKYDEKAAAPTSDAFEATPAAAPKAVGDIEKAIVCKPSSTLDESLKKLGIPTLGDQVPAPTGMKLYGSPVEKVSFSRESGYVVHSAYFPPEVSLESLAKAAGLKAGKNSTYYRLVRISKGLTGELVASRDKGVVVLQCGIDQEAQMDPDESIKALKKASSQSRKH